MFTYLIALLAVLVMIAGISIYAMRRSGVRWRLSSEDQETQAGLYKAFGKDRKWGSPGSAERESHDRNFSEHSDIESSDSDSAD